MDVPADTFEEAKELFQKVLQGVSRSGGRTVIVFDALNQLDHTHQAHNLEWLPKRFDISLPRGPSINKHIKKVAIWGEDGNLVSSWGLSGCIAESRYTFIPQL